MWLLADLCAELPEAGDLDKPRLVFFFDEAHLLFDDTPKTLLDKIEQLVLIRSKGVGVYFVTQTPHRPPGRRPRAARQPRPARAAGVHPGDEKAIRATAGTFRANPAFKTEDAITALGVGEALVSTLEGKGTPTMVRRVVIRPPASQIGPVDEQMRAALLAAGPFAGRYDLAIDRQSAYEVLAARAEAAARDEAARVAEKPATSPTRARTTRGRREPDGFAEAFAKSAMRSASRWAPPWPAVCSALCSAGGKVEPCSAPAARPIADPRPPASAPAPAPAVTEAPAG